MSEYPASKKLWRISRTVNGYCYEIKLAGVVIDRIKIEEPTLTYLKQKQLIEERQQNGRN